MSKERKEYIFNFEGGGWNSVYATSYTEAVKLANEKYGHIGVLENTVRLKEEHEDDYKNLMSMFW